MGSGGRKPNCEQCRIYKERIEDIAQRHAALVLSVRRPLHAHPGMEWSEVREAVVTLLAKEPKP